MRGRHAPCCLPSLAPGLLPTARLVGPDDGPESCPLWGSWCLFLHEFKKDAESPNSPCPWVPQAHSEPRPQAWICCCPGCGPVLGAGPVGKREMKAQWEVGGPRRPSQCRTQSHKVARRAASAGLVLVLEPQGPPGKSTGPPAHLQAGPRTRGETCRGSTL